MRRLSHLTLTTGDLRTSPRSEVADAVIDRLRPIVQAGAGALSGVSILVERTGDPWVWTLGRVGDPEPAVVCVLSRDGSPAAWRSALAVAGDVALADGLAEPPPPWLAVALLPAAAHLDRERLMALADAERCIAWAILEEAGDAA